MKRILLILTSILSLSSLSAGQRALSGDALFLFGIKGRNTSLSLVLDSTDTMESNGYSFLMTDPEVQALAHSTNQTGKRIASWYLVSNTDDVSVSVSHTPLACEIDPAVRLDYVLSVQYSREAPYNLNIRAGEEGVIDFGADGHGSIDIAHYGLFVRLTEPFDTANPGGYYGSTVTMAVTSNS